MYPLYHVLADVSGAESVIPCRSSRPLEVEALALTHEGRTRVLLANLSQQPAHVVLSGLGPRATLRVLDATTLQQATHAPASYRSSPGDDLSVNAGRAELTLGPDAVVTIDSSPE